MHCIVKYNVFRNVHLCLNFCFSLELHFSFSSVTWTFSKSITSCCPWSHGLRQKNINANVAEPSALVRVPSQWPLALVSCQSHQSANDKVKPEPLHRFSGINRSAETNSRKLQLGDCLMKAVQPVIASNSVPYLQ